MFMLIIWLQGIWLPEHGYTFESAPLWAGIYMVPLTIGFLIAGPVSGYLSDHFGARPFACGGMIGAAVAFYLLEQLPINFSFPEFGSILLLMGIAMGIFAAPNRAGVMNSLPAGERGVGGGMNSTFQNSAQVLSIGVFFSLMIAGLSSTLPHALAAGLRAQGVGPAAAARVSHLPPVEVLFAAFLGYNPAQQLLGTPPVPGHQSVLANLKEYHPAGYHTVVGHSFFPQLIARPFHSGLHEAFLFAILASLVAALASVFRGGRYVDTGMQDADRLLEETATA